MRQSEPYRKVLIKPHGILFVETHLVAVSIRENENVFVSSDAN
jgi:hypothetical protein